MADSSSSVDVDDSTSEAVPAGDGAVSSSSSSSRPTSRTIAITSTRTDDDKPEGDASGTANTTTPGSSLSLVWRKASFTEPESFVLNSLLVDGNEDNENRPLEEVISSSGENVLGEDTSTTAAAVEPERASRSSGEDVRRRFSADMVSSVPFNLGGESLLVYPRSSCSDEKHWAKTQNLAGGIAQQQQQQQQREPPKRMSILGLWSAHAAGVPPRVLVRHHHHRRRHQATAAAQQQQQQQAMSEEGEKKNVDTKMNDVPRTIEETIVSKEEESSASSYPSDVDVVNGGGLLGQPDDDDIDSLSWDSQDDMNHHTYDAWEVLKDEYSNEYGFGFASSTTTQSSDEDGGLPTGFAILGTSADDASARPHVLSPPLLDSLMNFLPDNIAGQNYWLRFSLVRDGASLETLKRYVRAADHTIIAMETPTGQVFGVYCSSPWRNHHTFFGSPEGAFVWKMRYSRRTKCASLFEQAHLESEIDVYMAAPKDPEQPLQVCRHDILGVGGYDDDIGHENAFLDDDEESSAEFLRTRTGFAICIDEYLARGSTSFSATFHNPSLCGKADRPEVFDIANLEVWSLTPCLDVDTAERLELRKYFVEHNGGGNSSSNLSTSSPSGRQRQNSRSSLSGSAADLTQESFFRRVGHDAVSERRREHWQSLNSMNPELGPNGKNNRNLGSSPRYA